MFFIFNQDKILSLPVLSVISQGYENLEYIIVDDGSTDGTSQVVSRYAEKCTVIHTENRGQSSALNLGWSVSDGDILGYLSGDDVLRENAISELVSTLLNSEAIAVYCNYDIFDSEGRVVQLIEAPDWNFFDLNEKMICQPGPGALFKKDAFLQVGGWDESLKQVVDLEFWMRLSKLGDFVKTPKSLAKYRVHKDSASFRKISLDRCLEINGVVKNNQAHRDLHFVNKRKAKANAHLLSCRYCLRSGYFFKGAQMFALSIFSFPAILFELRFYRVAVGGPLKRLFVNFRLISR